MFDFILYSYSKPNYLSIKDIFTTMEIDNFIIFFPYLFLLM